jgi:hypothetical protein
MKCVELAAGGLACGGDEFATVGNQGTHGRGIDLGTEAPDHAATSCVPREGA